MEAQEIVRTKCSLYSDDLQSSDDETESSITRSEDTDTPEPRLSEKSPAKELNRAEDGVVLQLKKLNVEDEE